MNEPKEEAAKAPKKEAERNPKQGAKDSESVVKPRKESRKPKKQARRGPSAWSTLDRLSWVVLASIAIVVVAFVFLCLTYDASSNDASRGIPENLRKFVIASYGPVVLATALGYRDVLFSRVSIGATRERAAIRIHSGSGRLYFFSALGPAVVVAILVIVALGIDEEFTKTLLTGGAAFWGATTGLVYHKFIAEYASPSKTKSDKEEPEDVPSGT